MKYLIVLVMFAMIGCDGRQAREGFAANNEAAFKACIDSGGVPIQAWFNEQMLADCVYKPTINNDIER